MKYEDSAADDERYEREVEEQNAIGEQTVEHRILNGHRACDTRHRADFSYGRGRVRDIRYVEVT